jgi:hypothetical protein
MKDDASAAEGVRRRPTPPDVVPCVGEESAGKNADVGIGVVAAINRRSRAKWKDDSNMVCGCGFLCSRGRYLWYTFI